MLEYSKFTFEHIVNSVKRFAYWCNVAMQSILIVYLAYASLTTAGILWADIALLVICSAYFIYFLITTKCNPLHKENEAEKQAKKFVKYSKLIIKTCTLAITMYGLYVAATNVSPISLILTTLSLVAWLLQVILEVIILIVEELGKLISEAFAADMEGITKPINNVKNFFKKAAGKEIDDPKEKSKRRIWLDEKVAKVREEKSAKKLAEKQAKQQAKLEKKNAVKTEEK